MRITEQFCVKKSLDRLFQLMFISTNFFTSFEFQNDMCFLQIDKDERYTDLERRVLLTYFLDLIEFFSHERVRLIEDPGDSYRFALNGGF
ncbi:MAG: hypothetical protein ACXAC8_13030 [Candidatus Hodarchaeales archaeon]|jgi:hypothetical protein